MYTMFGSVGMLLAIVYLYLTLDLYIILCCWKILRITGIRSAVDLGSIFFCIAVKLPLLPVHLWLPEAHVEAPTAGVYYWQVFC